LNMTEEGMDLPTLTVLIGSSCSLFFSFIAFLVLIRINKKNMPLDFYLLIICLLWVTGADIIDATAYLISSLLNVPKYGDVACNIQGFIIGYMDEVTVFLEMWLAIRLYFYYTPRLLFSHVVLDNINEIVIDPETTPILPRKSSIPKKHEQNLLEILADPKRNWIYPIISLTLPLVIGVIPFAFHGYGPSGLFWCWISMHLPVWERAFLVMGCSYFWVLLSFFWMFWCLAMIRRHSTKEHPAAYYILGCYLVVWIGPTVQRVIFMFGIDTNELDEFHAITSSLKGCLDFVIVLVMLNMLPWLRSKK